MNRTSLIAASTALAASLLLALAPTGALAAERGPKPRRVATCGLLAETSRQPARGTRVDVLRTRGVPCAAARRVVRRCIRGTLGRRWVATSPQAATLLSKGRTTVAFRTVAGRVPGCVARAQRIVGATAAERTLEKAISHNDFGPYEAPTAYPDRLPPPYRIVYEWGSPVTTNAAAIPTGSVSSVELAALVRNVGGEARAAWFEYGPTRDLGRSTEKQAVATAADGAPVRLRVTLSHLRAGTRYWWRAAASFDTADGGVETRYGVLGSFVTMPYPRIANPSRPCQSSPKTLASLFELTESLAIACTTRQMSRGACFPACAGFYGGRLRCDRTFPRNLNAGRWSFGIPKIGIRLNVDKLVSYWRSNDSNRFRELPGLNKNSGGGEVGPVAGWHDWDVAQWAYPFTSTKTTADFWINCTEQWGTVIDGSALAAGEGGDRPDLTPPGTPRQLTARPTPDGGIDVSWQAPASPSPTGLAGYALMVTGFKDGEPREFGLTQITPITTTATSGRISAANVAVAAKSMVPGWRVHVAVGAVSREGSVSRPATLPWPAP